MVSLKRIIAIAVSYLAVFAGTVVIYGLIQNSGTISGSLEDNSATLPLVYVRAGGSLINEMHGFTQSVDAGYYRDTMTPVDSSRSVNLVIKPFEYSISSASYELYNDQNTELVESGDCSELQGSDSGQECQINFQKELDSNCEYCLHIKLNYGEDGYVMYYTRVRYGSDLKIGEKLRFVLDFNEQTFSKDSAPALADYLESTGSGSASDYSYVDIYSSSDAVTWGSLAPNRTSDVSIRLKEINTETASFTLKYDIESKADSINTFYTVSEYYRIRIGDDKIYLLDFQRNMTEDTGLEDVSVTGGRIRLGLGDGSECSLVNYGTDSQQYSYITDGRALWVYDSTNRILTDVFRDQDTAHNCARQEETAIKVMHADAATGDLYFVLYGYMHEGRYEGREGVMVYHFTYEDDMLEELMFIPYDRGFEQLSEGISKLSYMNDEGMIYLMIENSIYEFSPSTGRMETAWENIDSKTCAVSDDGIIAMTADAQSGSGAGKSLNIIDLNSGEERTLDGGDSLITPLGYIGSDLIYGLVDSDRVAEDSSGVLCVPVSEVHIADRSLNDIKTYSKSGDYIMRTEVSGNMITFSLGKPAQIDGYTDYEDDGTDNIVHNVQTEDDTISIVSENDSTRGTQYYLSIGDTSDFIPVTQNARQLDPGYDISKYYVATADIDLCYYVYTRGTLAASFQTMKEAVDYGNEYAGTIMTSHKQIAWQRAGRAYIWDLGIENIEKAEKGSQNKTVIDTICSYEGWTAPDQVDNSKQLFAAMTDDLSAETINLTGIDLTDVLHFVYRDRVVVARTGNDTYALITGYTEQYITVADIADGTVSDISWDKAQDEFEKAGNVFYSYFD